MHTTRGFRVLNLESIYDLACGDGIPKRRMGKDGWVHGRSMSISVFIGIK